MIPDRAFRAKFEQILEAWEGSRPAEDEAR
jgi:hypothetical protein